MKGMMVLDVALVNKTEEEYTAKVPPSSSISKEGWKMMTHRPSYDIEICSPGGNMDGRGSGRGVVGV